MKTTVLFLLLLTIATSCAIFVPPTGGERDETGPELLSSIPELGQLNYNEKQIVLTFNELVETTKLQQELVVSPKLKNYYTIKTKNNVVTLNLNETLDENTTYYFNFRSGIKDLNEKNTSENTKIVFSTGNFIDSLSLKGSIKDLFLNKAPKKAVVALYDINKKDSVELIKRKPDYFYQTDTSGKFELNYLKAGQYKLLAFTDDNNNTAFDSKTELFAFKKDTIDLLNNTKEYTLKLSKYDIELPRIKQTISRENNFDVKLSKNLETYNIVYTNPKDTLTHVLINENTIRIYNNPVLTTDTLDINIFMSDSLKNDTTITQKIYFRESIGTKQKIKPLKITTNAKELAKINTPQPYLLSFELPITTVDTSKIYLLEDSIKTKNYTINWNNKSHTTLELKPEIENKLKELSLVIDDSAFIAYNADTSSAIQLNSKLLKAENLGTIKGIIANPDSVNTIIQLLKLNSQDIIYQTEAINNFEFKHILPGQYQIRTIEDINSNHRWDMADFNTNTYAENVYLKPEIINLKENFEIEINVENQSGKLE